MRLLADEGLHGGVVRLLRLAGYEVAWIKELSRGAQDVEILAWPNIREFVLLTNDRDFSDLIFNKGHAHPFAVLYSRLPHRLSQETFERFVAILEGGVPAGHIVTITKDGARARPFPIGATNG